MSECKACTICGGKKSAKSKLTAEQVKTIQSEYGIKTGTQLAKEYEVTHATIYAIINGKSWMHL